MKAKNQFADLTDRQILALLGNHTHGESVGAELAAEVTKRFREIISTPPIDSNIKSYIAKDASMVSLKTNINAKRFEMGYLSLAKININAKDKD